MINEDAAGELMSFNGHIKLGGYLVEAGKNPAETLWATINQIMGIFK